MSANTEFISKTNSSLRLIIQIFAVGALITAITVPSAISHYRLSEVEITVEALKTKYEIDHEILIRIDERMKRVEDRIMRLPLN